MSSALHILGIRHHGPGSARSVCRALDALAPQCVLIEGPPDADALIPHVPHAQMEPPVAILVHDVAEPARAAYYPFAAFSPEWQAMRWAVANGAAVRFMDLPQAHRIAIDAQRLDELKRQIEAATPDADEPDEVDGSAEAPADVNAAPLATALVPPLSIEPDPLQRLAEAAGFDDGERWWEHVVESNRDDAAGGVEIFAAIRDAMTELRATGDPRRIDPDEPYREAWMRRTIREAIKEGHETIAVICGAWHAPALDVGAVAKKDDDALLKNLPKVKTDATWVPWTYDRLAYASGYGAGVTSPGWYEHLWQHEGETVLEAWMTRVARTLRAKDVDCSSAHVIEAVRLARTVAAMRGRPLADLSDIADATRAIFCFDSDAAMRLIGRELLVGVRIGGVPDDVPAVPLQQDLNRLQKRLRLKPEAQERSLDLDLRSETDRERSVLLHRLRLLGIDWGEPAESHGNKGTFREGWRLRWEPEYAVKLIIAGALGNTVESASGARLTQIAAETLELKALTERLQDAMLADLGNAARALVRQIESVAAIASDVATLMDALPALANLLRYGNVRDTDAGTVRDIVDGIVPRVAVGLGGGVASLNDDAADEYQRRLRATDAAISLVDDAAHLSAWRDALARVSDQPSVHGLIRGLAARLLLDAGRLDAEAVGLQLNQALSRGNDPAHGARWLEGFLSGSGLLLIHDAKLLGLIDAWVAEITPDVFDALLPLLRRTFATFPGAERRQIAGALNAPTPGRAGIATIPTSIDRERAERPLAMIVQLLGGTP